MSKLDELIQEMCPDGVEYKTLGEIFDIRNGYTPSKKNKSFWENGSVPWFRLEDIRVNGRILTLALQNVTENAVKNNKFPANSLIISTTATIGEHALVKTEFLCNQQLTCVSIKKNNLNKILIKYCYYYFDIIDEQCKKIANNGGGMAIVSLSKFKELKIAIPPLPVQEEIVRILDNFTELIDELTAELTARKKQYEYYHQRLMDFSNQYVKFVNLGDYFEFKNGLNKEKSAFGKGYPIVNFTDVYNHRWLNASMLKGLVDVSDLELNRYSAKKGDVFFTRTSETKEDIGMSSTLIEDIPNCVFSGFVLRARPKTDLFLPKFCSYYFSTNKVRKEIIRYASVTTRATTTGPKLSRIKIPLVPICEQQRIVDILDRFDKLCNDISGGLPAEIEARQKQYEYYRDKLLTFKPLEEVK